MISLFTRRGTRVVLLSAAALGLAGGAAYATIPDGGGGVFTACMLKNVGTIRLIDPSLPASSPLSHCTAFETQIAWNLQGPPGPQGSQGPAGKDGAPGKDGVSPTVTQLAAGDAHCSAGGAAITDAAGNTAYVCNGVKGADGQPFSGTFRSPDGSFSVDVTNGGIALTGPGGSVKLGAAGLDVNGTLITLNGDGSCSPAARQGDAVNVTGFAEPSAPGVAAPLSASGAIAQGSNTVCIGP